MEKNRSFMENLCKKVAGGKEETALDEKYARVLNLFACDSFAARDDDRALCASCRYFETTPLSQNMGFGWCKK